MASTYPSIFLLVFLCLFGVQSKTIENGPNRTVKSNFSVHIGVLVDLSSPLGAMLEICTSMAISDFYAMHSNYQTRLFLHTKDSKDVSGTVLAVLDLLKNEEVHAIIGPQRSAEATFVIELAKKAHVPTVSFSATSPSLSLTRNPYFIRTTQNDSSQVKAISAIFQEFEWHEVVLIYEDTEYGNGIIPHLTDALQEINIQITYKSSIPIFAEDFQMSKELNMLMAKQSRVFLVHMTISLGSRLFALVDKAGMMSEGYAWIITDGLSNSLDALDPTTIDSMEGVLGIRPHVPESKEVENFKMRYKRNSPLTKLNSMGSEVNIFGLWAYDTIWALAMAVERIGPINLSFLKVNNGKKARDHANFGVSQIGPRLLNEILNTKFKGLSGEFHLVNGQLQQSAYEILNVIGKGERIVGYWSLDKRISRKLSSTERQPNSTSKNEYKKILWPGLSTIVPKGSVIPIIRKKLIIGIPKTNGFTDQFVRIHHHKNQTNISGYSIDVFKAVIAVLPFKVPYQFEVFINESGESAGTYDELLSMIDKKKYDAVVGDITIVANRTSMVDFTLPYTESGVTMLVQTRHDNRKNMWIFLKPLTWDLWLTIIIACIFIGLVMRIMERHENTEFNRAPRRQLCMILWFPFQLLAFPQREMVVNNYSKYVMVVWLFMAYILMQSYTANLSSILTVNRLEPTLFSVSELKRKGCYVGYQKNSFVEDLLTKQLNFTTSKLRPYSTIHQFHHALSKGSKNGGVDAIFDEIPYITLFLAKYGSDFMMAGKTYRTGGFGFAFSIGSPLVSYISRAILNVTEDKVMDNIEKKYFGKSRFEDQAAPIYPNSDSPSLDAYSFAGLFIIAGIATLLLLLGSEGYLWQKPVAVARQYSQRFLSPQPSNATKPTIESATEVNVIGHSFTVESATKVNVVESSYAVESTTEVNVVELSSAVDNAEISPTISHQSDETSSREQGHSL